MNWWIWILLGVALGIGEMAIPGTLFLIFFALASLVVGIVSTIFLDISLTSQLIIFGLSSVILLVLLRPTIIARLNREDKVKEHPIEVGQKGVCICDIPRGSQGRIELAGSTWQALNVGDSDLKTGSHVLVVDRKGLLIEVQLG
jgi:membrane protein implicated in regulation of membrane protease activity